MEPLRTRALAKTGSSRRNVQTVEAFKTAIVDHLYYEGGQGAYTASIYDVYNALVHTVRDLLIERYRVTVDALVASQPRFVYYLSAEYLPGKQLTQNLLYTGTAELARQALIELGYDLDELINLEPEPALGNGGLGRLAACFMDSLATLDIPTVSYGIHYEFGIFNQSFRDGWQVENPDEWLVYGNSWEFPQPDNRVQVGFGGRTESYTDPQGQEHKRWIPAQTVMGEPTHTLVPGFGTSTVNMLRLWRARASKEFDFQLFDVGDYSRAAEQKISSENISKVLYPNDNTPQGRELRLKQEYFFVACSLKDILRRYQAFSEDWSLFTERVVIQLNDTHPVLAIPELMRLLVDEHLLEWDQAWEMTTGVFAYTCHTLLPEALERWPVSLLERLLPRHMEIIFRINQRFLDIVEKKFPDDLSRRARLSIIEEGPERLVRMAFLATIGSFSVNGVAELHTRLMQKLVLPDFASLWPEKFNNKTNGVSPRRFVQLANPRLTHLISSRIGEGWLSNLDELRNLEVFAGDEEFRERWRAIKLVNKRALAAQVERLTGIRVDPHSMYDVMVKRLHEYKRQHLKALHIITLYNRLKADPDLEMVPRTFIFWREGCPRLPDCQVNHQADQLTGRGDQFRPRSERAYEGCFCAQFQRYEGRMDLPCR
jgi:glycogen phosphorylase